MATTSQQRVGNTTEALRIDLAPFVAREFINRYKGQTVHVFQQILSKMVHDDKEALSPNGHGSSAKGGV